MKYLLLLIATGTFTSALQAQINKGQWMVGGAASFIYRNSKVTFKEGFISQDMTNLQLSPQAGYFVANKFCIGLRPGFIAAKVNIKSNETFNGSTDLLSTISKGTELSIAPFVRYYFLPAANKVNLLADISYGYSHSSYTYSRDDNYIFNFAPAENTDIHPLYGTTGNSSELVIAVGPVIFLNSKSAIEMLGAYKYLISNKWGDRGGYLYISAGFQIYL